MFHRAQLHVVQISINFFFFRLRGRKKVFAQTDILHLVRVGKIPAQVVVVDTFAVVVS